MALELSQLRDNFYTIAKELHEQFDHLGTQKEIPKAGFCQIEGTFPSLLNRSIIEQCEHRLSHIPKLESSSSLQNRREYALAISILLARVYNSLAKYHLTYMLNLIDSLLTTVISNVTFPIKALNGALLTMEDLSTVKIPEAWLNDEVINSQISLINASCDRISVANTHFYSKALNSGPYSIESWLRPMLSRQIEVFVIPMNLNNTHWVACSIHIKSHFILCFDSMHAINTNTIRPILMLLVAHADMFGLTKDLICNNFIILFPGYTRTFLEINTEHHILEELSNIEANHISETILTLPNTKTDILTTSAISISSTESNPEHSTGSNILKSTTNIDSKSKRFFKQIVQQRSRLIYYRLFQNRPRMCGISKYTTSIDTYSGSMIDAEEQDYYTASQENNTSINIILELMHIVNEHIEVIDTAKQKLKDDGLDTILNTPSSELLSVDVKRADKILCELHKQYKIGSILTSAAEAVLLSLDMPYQQNGYDCGVYMLLFIKMIARQFGPGYPLLPKDTKKARIFIAVELCTQRLLITPQDLGDLY